MRPTDPTTTGPNGHRLDRSEIVVVDDIIYLPEPHDVGIGAGVVPSRWAHPAPEDGCPHTELELRPNRMVAPASEQAPHYSFAAAVETNQPTIRKYRLPIASTILTITGQIALGATVGATAVPAVVGAAVMLAWLIGGCLLIAAQCVHVAGNR